MQWRFTSHGRGVMRNESAEACRMDFNRRFRLKIGMVNQSLIPTKLQFCSFLELSTTNLSLCLQITSNIFSFVSSKNFLQVLISQFILMYFFHFEPFETFPHDSILYQRLHIDLIFLSSVRYLFLQFVPDRFHCE